jgi:hypothetical protein
MSIKKIVSKILLEASISKKDFPNIVRQKLMDVYPVSFNELTPEEQEKYINHIIVRHDQLKATMNVDNPIVNNFLLRHDGSHGSRKVELQQLQSLPQAPIAELIDLMNALGKFEKRNLSTGTGNEPEKTEEEIEKEKVDSIFLDADNKPTEKKLEYSKSMWEDSNTPIINENGVRVYYIKDQETSERFGYFYESIFKQQYKLVKGDPQFSSVNISAPWCQVWRGSSYRGYEIKDENGKFMYSHSQNKWGDMREDHRYTFYYLIDDKINPLENIVDKGQYHMVAIAVKPNGGIILSPMLNVGEISKSWSQLVDMYPELDSHRNLFENEEFDPSELKIQLKQGEIKISEIEGSPKEFARLTPDEQISWIQNEDKDIQKVKSWKAMAPAVRSAYIATITPSNLTHKIGNHELYKIIISSGFGQAINKKVENGVTKLALFYVGTDFDVAFLGKKVPTTIVYSNKRTKYKGIFDTLEGRWVTKDGIIYDDRFVNKEREGDITFTDDGNTVTIYKFEADNGDKFYVIHDEGKDHIGYIVSSQMYDSFRSDYLNDTKTLDPKSKQVDIGEMLK